jgi:hypothetical protein
VRALCTIRITLISALHYCTCIELGPHLRGGDEGACLDDERLVEGLERVLNVEAVLELVLQQPHADLRTALSYEYRYKRKYWSYSSAGIILCLGLVILAFSVLLPLYLLLFYVCQHHAQLLTHKERVD